MTEQTRVEILKGIAGLHDVVLAVKATGGYKFRNRIRLANNEIDAFLEESVRILVRLFVTKTIAEKYILDQCGETRLADMRKMVESVMEELQASIDQVGDPDGDLASDIKVS
jgi:hypothetical protein